MPTKVKRRRVDGLNPEPSQGHPISHPNEVTFTPKQIWESIRELEGKHPDINQELIEYYAQVARHEGLSGRGVDVAAGLNIFPSRGLVKGGLDGMFLTDRIYNTKDPYPLEPRIHLLHGESTRLPFRDHSMDLVLFHRSLEFIRGYAGGLKPPKINYSVEGLSDRVLESSVAEAVRILKPGGGIVLAEMPADWEGDAAATQLLKSGFKDLHSPIKRLSDKTALVLGRR